MKALPLNGRQFLQLALLSPSVNSGGISVQQELDSPQGDYRRAHYTNIKLHEKIPDNVFRLKTTGKTQFLPAGG